MITLEFMLEKVDEPPPLKPQPPRRPPRNRLATAAAEWPTEDDLIMLHEMWVKQSYAGYTSCYKCTTMEYCHGPYYEKKSCFGCFITAHKPKRKYTKRPK